jgi:hypothetical protein
MTRMSLLVLGLLGVESMFEQHRFVIGGGPDPPPTNQSYSNLRNAGVTFLHADSNEVTTSAQAALMASLCEVNNLSCVVPFGTYKHVPTSDAVWGYFLKDEPRVADFSTLAAEVTQVRQLRPDALSFINLLGYVNDTLYPTKAKQLYGVDTWEQYVDMFLSTVKPDVLSYDYYPDYSGMDQFHYELGFMRNKSQHAGLPLWTYVWLSANGHGKGAGFYRWQMFVASAYGATGIMQWSLSPCADIHACGPKSRWAPFPCLLDKRGGAFKPVFKMVQVSHKNDGR